MNHETLQALYALDVAEVGKDEAVKRWEFKNYICVDETWHQHADSPNWIDDVGYRRKPGIPWPKVMDSKKVQELESYICNELRDLKIDTEQTTQEWPADAPEWAKQIVTLYSDDTSVRVGRFEVISVLGRPKPVLKKIDWSKLRVNWSDFSRIHLGNRTLQSKWIAWNCDENTRGNPLPDGLVVEWYGYIKRSQPYINQCQWNNATRFRIIGILDGWK